ncbi:MAG: histidinol dehydrogenase [Alphaproteobacteria bacterium]
MKQRLGTKAMTIASCRWADISESEKERLLRRAQADIDDVAAQVKPIIEDVRTRGDAALRDCARKFERRRSVRLKPKNRIRRG